MKKIIPLILIFTVLTKTALFAQDATPVQSFWSEDSQLTYYMHNGYGFPRTIVSTVGKLLEENDDVSVCLYLGKDRGIDPRIIAGMRKKGFSWDQAMKSTAYENYRLYQDLGILDAAGVPPRFRETFKKYDKWKNQGGILELSDGDVRDLVQLRFCVNTFGVPIGEVLKAGSRNNWTQVILNQGRP